MYTFTGENPTILQLQALNTLFLEGDEYSPRGKKIKEIRPVCIEFTNPLNRVTFLRGRKINPFFQLAESLWIVSGHSDVAFLEKFNANMKSFSDDGVYFNASYGERLRYYGKNDLHKIIYNPVDQLEDVYTKITTDPDTRQAIAVISHPQFDNSNYTIGEQGKDIACNLILTFKLRNGKLDLTVFNRSNDIFWGLWGANLAQFSTIQEMMASWLGAEVGTYRQITDSLHVYLEDYGSGITGDIERVHPGITTEKLDINQELYMPEDFYFTFQNEPRMRMNKQQTNVFLQFFWNSVAPILMTDEAFTDSDDAPIRLLNVLMTDEQYRGLTDEYWRMAIGAMVAYRYYKMDNLEKTLKVLSAYVADSSWKVSMMYFLKARVKKAANDKITTLYASIVANLRSTLVYDGMTKPEAINLLNDYLNIG